MKNRNLFFRRLQDYSKLYVNLENMHQDAEHGVIDYTKYISIHAIMGYIVSNEDMAPFHIMFLHITQ